MWLNQCKLGTCAATVDWCDQVGDWYGSNPLVLIRLCFGCDYVGIERAGWVFVCDLFDYESLSFGWKCG